MPISTKRISQEEADAYTALGVPYEGYIEGRGYQHLIAFSIGQFYFEEQGFALPDFVPVLDDSPDLLMQSKKLTSDDLMRQLVQIKDGGAKVNMGHGRVVNLSQNCEIIARIENDTHFVIGYIDRDTGKEEAVKGLLSDFHTMFEDSSLLFGENDSINSSDLEGLPAGFMELPYYATGTSFLTGAAEYHLNKKLRPYRPIRYNNPSLFKPGDVARHLDTGKLMSGSRYLQTARGLLYWTGVGAGLLGVFLSYQDYRRGSGGKKGKVKLGADLIFSGIGFCGVPGLMLSTTYFIATSPAFQQGVKEYHEKKQRAFGKGGDWERLPSDFFYNGGLCFKAGTSIIMGDRSEKLIQDVVSGDVVLTYDFDRKVVAEAEVLMVDAPFHDNLIQVTFENGISIVSTDDHPYFVKDKGWCAYASSVTVARYGIATLPLCINDLCLLHKDEGLIDVGVKRIDSVKGRERTFNLSKLRGANCYFANGFLVSNESPQKY